MTGSGGHDLRPRVGHSRLTEQPPDDSGHPRSPPKRRPRPTQKRRSKNVDRAEQERPIEAENQFVISPAFTNIGLLTNARLRRRPGTPHLPYQDHSKPRPVTRRRSWS